MLNVTGIVNLGADPEELTLGARKVYKLRCADKAPGKNSVTRWLSVLVSGPDCDTAQRLAKGDSIMISGTISKTEYKPKKLQFKGQMMSQDEVPFGKILQVVKSDTFFNKQVGDFPDTSTPPELPGSDVGDISNVVVDPLADL